MADTHLLSFFAERFELYLLPLEACKGAGCVRFWPRARHRAERHHAYARLASSAATQRSVFSLFTSSSNFAAKQESEARRCQHVSSA